MAQPPVDADARIGTLCGNFRILRKIGEGGMGVVYEAEHQKIGKRAAVKVMHPEFATNAEFAERFLNEARAVNIIRHPSLVEIFEFGQLPDHTLFIVMEFLEGQTLYDRFVKKEQPAPLKPSLHIAYQVAQALAAAHEKHIVHRDLKPENIMLLEDPLRPGELRAKLLDFGIAKIAKQAGLAQTNHTQVGSSLGTQNYMAPEQHDRAEEAQGTADVFAFGVILYELLAGKPPFRGNALSLLMRAVPDLATVRTDVPASLSKLIAQMMQIQPAQRPSMGDVVALLSTLRETKRQRKANRLPLLIAIGGVASLLLFGVALLTTRWLRPPTLADARNRALAVVKRSIAKPEIAEQIQAIAAIGQSQDASLRTLVVPFLSSDSIEIQEAAARAIGDIGAIDASSSLVPLLKSKHETVQLAAAKALARLSHTLGQKTLKELLDHGTDPSRIAAALALLEFGDLSGSPLLHRIVARNPSKEGPILELLSALAKAGDDEAQQILRDQQGGAFGKPHFPHISFALARIGDNTAQTQLEQLATKSGPSQLVAARLLAGLGDHRGYPLFLDAAKNGHRSESERAIAVDGLSELAQLEAVIPLVKVMDERGISTRLRLLTAGAILELAAGEKGQLAEQGLAWARDALGSDNAATRELATMLLADTESDSTLASLVKALKDQSKEVRQSAARALGKRPSRESLHALASALEDSDEDVRALSIRSMARMVTQLRTKGTQANSELEKQVVADLQKATESKHELDRVVAAGTLLQLGDSSRRKGVEGGLQSSNPLVRRSAIEFAPLDSRLLGKSLTDTDKGVRFAAAKRLAPNGSREAMSVLREFHAAGEAEGYIAYGILRRIGEPVEPPLGIKNLLSASGPAERLSMLDTVAELPLPLAQQVLLAASHDPVSVIRRRAVDLSSQLFNRTKELAFLRLLRSEIHDKDLAVRNRARELLSTIPSASMPEAVDTISKDNKSSDPTPISGEQGQLLLSGEEGVRIQIDKGPSQMLPSKTLSIPLTVGKHLVEYVGGKQELAIAVGSPTKLKIPASLAEQLVHDAKDALKSRDLVRAQGHLDRLKRIANRVRPKAIVLSDALYLQGKLFEAKNQPAPALGDLATYLKLPSVQQRSEYVADAKTITSRWKPLLGRLQLYTLKDGVCQLEERYLQPGEHEISLTPGQTKKVSAFAGVTVTIRSCN
ncbi:MAG TPA: protein kinase [Pseudomonadota bacterium]|nr:protein kinase [Pseudomonadota bacterium]